MRIWIIGRAATLPNGHVYPAEPFIAFETEKDAVNAIEMVETVSGERPIMADAALYRRKPAKEAGDD